MGWDTEVEDRILGTLGRIHVEMAFFFFCQWIYVFSFFSVQVVMITESSNTYI